MSEEQRPPRGQPPRGRRARLPVRQVRLPGFTLTTEGMRPVADTVLPPLLRRIDEARYSGEAQDITQAALIDALIEGARWAMVEFTAQLIDAGVQVELDMTVMHALDPEDEGE
jgi:hypothetical protein